MNTFIRLCDRISQASGVLSGILLIVALALTCAEMLVRGALDRTLYITEEYTGYLMAAITFLALAYTLKEKSHIRMTFLYEVLKGRSRTMLDIYSFAVGCLFCIILTWTTAHFFWDSVVNGSRSMQTSATYLAIPQFFMPLGTSIMALQFAAETCRSILRFRSNAESETESSALGR